MYITVEPLYSNVPSWNTFLIRTLPGSWGVQNRRVHYCMYSRWKWSCCHGDIVYWFEQLKLVLQSILYPLCFHGDIYHTEEPNVNHPLILLHNGMHMWRGEDVFIGTTWVEYHSFFLRRTASQLSKRFVALGQHLLRLTLKQTTGRALAEHWQLSPGGLNRGFPKPRPLH